LRLEDLRALRVLVDALLPAARHGKKPNNGQRGV
jgi:hypothetical protein